MSDKCEAEAAIAMATRQTARPAVGDRSRTLVSPSRGNLVRPTR